MKSKILSAVLIAILSANLPSNALAQSAPAQAQAQAAADNALAAIQKQTATFRAQAIKVAENATKVNTSSRQKFSNSVSAGWLWLNDQCPGDTITDKCAADAIELASNQCAASAQFLKKDTRSWQYLSFGLLIASAAFTGVGAATTIRGSMSIPKVFSTLGGATGIGAVASSANSNATGDQAALLSINATLNNFITYVTTGTAKGAAAAPMIENGLSASGTVGVSFAYQIVATNSPTSYLVTGLPNGLAFSASTGLISGTPGLGTQGTPTVTLAATNASGTSNSAKLALNIAAAAPTAAPVINSAAAVNGTVGAQLGYQISATNSPASYSVPAGSILPDGLSLNATGFINGMPKSPGTIPVTLTATNAVGTSNPFILTFNIAAAVPAGNGPAPNNLVYKVASLYATECEATALNSSTK